MLCCLSASSAQLSERHRCWHWNVSFLLDQNGPWDGPAAEGRFYRCRKHGFRNHEGHDVRWQKRESTQSWSLFFWVTTSNGGYVHFKGNILPGNVKVSAPSIRNLGRFQVFGFLLQENKSKFFPLSYELLQRCREFLMADNISGFWVPGARGSGHSLQRGGGLRLGCGFRRGQTPPGSARSRWDLAARHRSPHHRVSCSRSNSGHVGRGGCLEAVFILIFNCVGLKVLMFFSFSCQLLPENTVVIRMMPNLPCLVQEGALLFARGAHAKPEDGALLRSLLHHCGLVEEGPETWIDIHTGMSGSGVAFVSHKMTPLWEIVNGFYGLFSMVNLAAVHRCICLRRLWPRGQLKWECRALWPTASHPKPSWSVFRVNFHVTCALHA